MPRRGSALQGARAAATRAAEPDRLWTPHRPARGSERSSRRRRKQSVGSDRTRNRHRDRREGRMRADRKSTRLNSSHLVISYAVVCLQKWREEVVPGEPSPLVAREYKASLHLRDSDHQLHEQLSFIKYLCVNDPATTEIYTLSLHDALPICYNHPFVSALDYDPADPGTLYVAAGNGLIRVREHAQRWKILTGSDVTELLDVSVDRHAPGAIYFSFTAGTPEIG